MIGDAGINGIEEALKKICNLGKNVMKEFIMTGGEKASFSSDRHNRRSTEENL